MKRILLSHTVLIFILSISINLTSAQINYNSPWVKNAGVSVNEKINFQDVVNAGNLYWQINDKNAKGSGYKPFKRWEAFWENYVDEMGFLPSGKELWDTWKSKNSASQLRTSMNSFNDQSNWSSIGPTDFLNRSTSYLNLGRVNCVTPDPVNPNIVYVGTPSGGIWKSEDGGLTYVALSDDLPQIGVSSIVIDYTNPNIIYIATGDDDAGDSYSVGIWKSTDAGLNWEQTGMNPNNSPTRIYELEMHESNPGIIWAATNNGVYKTLDSGINWNQSQTGAFQGVKQKPGDPSIVYAITDSEFFKSIDGGESFNNSGFGLPSGSARLVMDVTPANNELVYIVASTSNFGFEGVYKSSNSGGGFFKMDNTQDIYESNQAWYDLAMAVSDTDENELYVGVLNVWKSGDGGDNFTQLSDWANRNEAYTHADIHFLKFYNNELFVGSDGGFFKSSNQGNTFTDFTGNMAISQFYRVSVSKQNSNKIAGGTQDNGGFAYFNEWSSYHGGDGMESVIDPNNDNIYYGFMQGGQTLFVNNDSGMSGYSGTQGYSGPTNGNWITPLSINSQSEVFAGYNRLYQFENGDFTAISSNFGTNIDVLELDPINSDIIYVATDSNLHKSSDRGVNFINLGSFPNNITSIEVHNNDNNIIYVTTRGSSGKVYKSINQAVSFTNISGSLPSVVKNMIKHQVDTPENVLYLGTSLGVYRYDDNTNDWLPFEINLPNTSVRDLSINIPDNQIIASTYGRGIWRSTMPITSLASDDIKLVAIENPSTINISCGDLAPQIRVKNNGQNLISEIEISYFIDNDSPTIQIWNGSIDSLDEEIIQLQPMSINFGEHQFYASVSIQNDFYNSNNNLNLTFNVNRAGATQTINTFETISDNLLVASDSGDLWERGEPTGEELNTTTSGTQVYGTNLDGEYSNNTKSYLYSPCFDLTTIGNPILKFNMAFEIEFDWDLLFMEYSTDLGENWNILGDSEDINWYNSSRFSGDGVNNNCYNCVGAQWTGNSLEMIEYAYDLAEFAEANNIIFRFVFHTDNYVTAEGVIIDDLVVEGTTLNSLDYELQQISIYPNPSSDIFNIRMNNIPDFKIFIRDITAKLLYKDYVNYGISNYKIDMTKFSKGVYILEIESNSKRITKKIILN